MEGIRGDAPDEHDGASDDQHWLAADTVDDGLEVM